MAPIHVGCPIYDYQAIDVVGLTDLLNSSSKLVLQLIGEYGPVDNAALARAPELRLAGCPFPHVKDWELLTDPASDTSVPSDLAWTTPAAGSAHLVRCRTFSALDRTVRLRLSRETSRDPAMAGRMVCDDVWVLEVDFPVVWRTNIPAIPPPRRVEPAALPYKEKTPSSSSSERSGRSWKRLVPKLLARG